MSLQVRNSTGGGFVLLQDTQLIETLAHFARERIPERVVHAKAVGAFGEFEVTHDISDLTSAKFLKGVGKKTPVLLRVSTVGPESGSADTARDVRGWAMKLFTKDGNQDFVFNDIPVFFIRDPIKFPSVNRSHKRHPRTHLPDSTMEGIHALMHLFSDRGTPVSIRNLNAYSGHTYKFTKPDGSFKYVKIHIKSDQGVKSHTASEATKLAGENPNSHTEDLFNAIENGDYPTWTLYVQVMDPKDAETYRWNIFDVTKIWPHADYPLRPFGKLTLNKNPTNYFTDVECVAFSPSTMVSGIGPTADPMLQARMFSYPDAARYRLGTNYQQLPVNTPLSHVYSPFQRGGFASVKGSYSSDPNYVHSTFKPLKAGPKQAAFEHEIWTKARVEEYTSEVTDEDFVQARWFWDVLGKEEGQQEHFIRIWPLRSLY
ncbi:catalase [Zopfia rhizophila CBS 207.26]|uniref:Catalase n=1 Tax=Zopfia rhizophila CBS 207.26 TaxID=1314779 RepID=A0A6A6E3C6_9PEZI|nr:catalase [Zopfia rhizophila CBS 207.26]